MSWGSPPPGPVVVEPQDSPEHPMAPWFAHLRERRREHYASRPMQLTNRRRAIITMVRNEPVFLPIWLGYYSRFFAAQDVYVIDNDTTDGSTDRSGFVRIPAEHDRVDAVWTLETIQQLQHDLIADYDIVLVTDVDELIVPTPGLGSLGDYLDRFDEEWVNCLGYELLHRRDREPPLDLARPVMTQRRYWFPNGAYDKAALTTAPLVWRPGFHGRADFHYNLDPDLRLIHLHRMDYDICRARHELRRRRSWNDHDVAEGWAEHNRITDEQEFARWFYEDSNTTWSEVQIEAIPPDWRSVF
jgi:hypothetical protein